MRAPSNRVAKPGEIPSSREFGVRCCYSCTCSIFTLILLVVSVPLGIGYIKPTISIEQFYVSALNMTSNNTHTINHTIFFDLKLKNNNDEGKTVKYAALNVTLYYARNLSFPVANVSIPGFSQGSGDSAHRTTMVTSFGVPWEIAQSVVVLNGTDVFRVNLYTSVRYKNIYGTTKRQQIMVGGNVSVNDQGNMVKHKKKGVILSSTAYLHVGYFAYSCGLVTLVLSFWL